MGENRLTYRRKVSNIGNWREFSVQHVAFALHRITGWVLLAWVAVHLGFPALADGGVWNPLTDLATPISEFVVVGLFAVLVFHAFNGVRLLAAELLGVGAGDTRRVFLGTLAASLLLVAGLGVAL